MTKITDKAIQDALAGYTECVKNGDWTINDLMRAALNGARYGELVQALTNIVNSDMAIMAEDEGRESSKLEYARTVLFEIGMRR